MKLVTGEDTLPWVVDILDAWLTGTPLNFGGKTVPQWVTQRIDSAMNGGEIQVDYTDAWRGMVEPFDAPGLTLIRLQRDDALGYPEPGTLVMISPMDT